MRTLSGTLLAAQKGASGVPYVRAVVKNSIRGVRHLAFSSGYAGAEADDQHGAAADDVYLHRVRVRGGRPQYQRGASASWTDLNAANDSAVIAVSAVAPVDESYRVLVVYSRAAALYFRESVDGGSSFGAETLILGISGAPAAVAVAYKGVPGDLCVFYEELNAVRRVRRTSGVWGSAAAWSKTVASVGGLAVVYAGDFHVVVVGDEETTENPTVWGVVMGDGFQRSVDSWGALMVITQADAESDVVFLAPSLALVDTYRLTYSEWYTGAGAYLRTYWTMFQPTESFSANVWMDPVPLDNGTVWGYAVTGNRTTVYYSRPGEMLSASLAAVTLDMSGDLLEAVIEEEGVRQRGELVFDNAGGQYVGPPSPIALHRDVELGLGYGAEYSSAPGQSIAGWEYRRDGGRSVFVLYLRGLDYWLGAQGTRMTVSLGQVSLSQIARFVVGRAGQQLVNVGASWRAINYNLDWTLQPYQSGLSALEAVVAMMPDILVGWGSGVVLLFEPLTNDAVVYRYGRDHAVYRSRTRTEHRATVTEVLGVGVVGQDFDYTAMNEDKPIQDRRRDPHALVAGDAGEHAAARMRKAELGVDLGYIETPTNCGLEVGDVVEYWDALVVATELKGRVTGIKTRFSRAGRSRVVYEQRVSLGGL